MKQLLDLQKIENTQVPNEAISCSSCDTNSCNTKTEAYR